MGITNEANPGLRSDIAASFFSLGQFGEEAGDGSMDRWIVCIPRLIDPDLMGLY